jgi:hypothetical protein
MNYNGNAKIEKTFDGIAIIVPSKKTWFSLIFGTFWLGGWFYGLVMVILMLQTIKTNDTNINAFLIFWMLAWIVGGGFIIAFLLWGYFGKEKFIIQRDKIVFEKSVFEIGKRKLLDRLDIKNFRYFQINESFIGGNRSVGWGFGTGKIKFDYGMKTYSFGLGLDEAEANYIIDLLNKEFKFR